MPCATCHAAIAIANTAAGASEQDAATGTSQRTETFVVKMSSVYAWCCASLEPEAVNGAGRPNNRRVPGSLDGKV